MSGMVGATGYGTGVAAQGAVPGYLDTVQGTARGTGAGGGDELSALHAARAPKAAETKRRVGAATRPPRWEGWGRHARVLAGGRRVRRHCSCAVARAPPNLAPPRHRPPRPTTGALHAWPEARVVRAPSSLSRRMAIVARSLHPGTRCPVPESRTPASLPRPCPPAGPNLDTSPAVVVHAGGRRSSRSVPDVARAAHSCSCAPDALSRIIYAHTYTPNLTHTTTTPTHAPTHQIHTLTPTTHPPPTRTRVARRSPGHDEMAWQRPSPTRPGTRTARTPGRLLEWARCPRRTVRQDDSPRLPCLRSSDSHLLPDTPRLASCAARSRPPSTTRHLLGVAPGTGFGDSPALPFSCFSLQRHVSPAAGLNRPPHTSLPLLG